MEQDVAGDAHGILQIALNLIEHVFGGTSEENGARLGGLAFGEEGEVLVTDLFNLEEAALGAHIGLLQILNTINNGGACGSRYPVVVCLAHTPEGGNVGFHEVVLCQVYKQSV